MTGMVFLPTRWQGVGQNPYRYRETLTMRFLAIIFALVFPLSTAWAAGDSLDSILAFEHVFDLPEAEAPWQFELPYQGETVVISVVNGRFDEKKVPPGLHRFARRRIEGRDRNLAFIRQAVTEISPLIGSLSKKYSLRSEIKRSLEDVAVSILGEGAELNETLKRHDTLFSQLPPYTNIHLLVAKARMDAVKKRLASAPYGDRVTLYPVDLGRPLGLYGATLAPMAVIPWMRDSLLVLNAPNAKDSVTLLPLAYQATNNLEMPDNAYLKMFESDARRMLSAPLFFRAGNVMMFQNEKKYLLLGEWEAVKNDMFFREAVGFGMSKERFGEAMRLLTGADQVVFLPNTEKLFHIDFVMTDFGDKTVGIVNPVDREHVPELDREALDFIRATMRDLGFKVVDIPTHSSRVMNYQSPANAVPFTDRRDGKHKALVPYFSAHAPADLERASPIDALIGDAYRGAGVEPIWVRDLFFEMQGNTHCSIMPFN